MCGAHLHVLGTLRDGRFVVPLGLRAAKLGGRYTRKTIHAVVDPARTTRAGLLPHTFTGEHASA